MMKFYRVLHYLSLDIVLGTLASSCLASRLFKASPGWAWWLALAFTVWVLYTGDHLVDAWRHRKKSKRELHLFIFRNRRVLIYSLVAITVADIMLIFNLLDRAFLKYGLILAGMVLLFYAMRHILRKNRVLFIPGEIFVLLIYMVGTWLGPFISRSGPVTTQDAAVAVMFAGIVLMNLGIISLYDINLDSRLGIASLAKYLGKKTTRNLLIAAGVMVYVLSILQFMIYGLERYARFALILSGMATILLLILFLPSVFRKNDAYRLAADSVLIMGFLSLLTGG